MRVRFETYLNQCGTILGVIRECEVNAFAAFLARKAVQQDMNEAIQQGGFVHIDVVNV